MRTKKNPTFNRFTPIVCGVLRRDEDSTPHTNRFSTRVPNLNMGNLTISGDLRINNVFYFNFRTKNMQEQ